MIRKLFFLLFAAIALSAYSAEKTDTLTVGSPVSELVYHLRVGAPRSQASFRLAWNLRPDGSCYHADITVPPSSDDETGLPAEGHYRIYHRSGCLDELLDEGKIAIAYSGGKQAGVSAVLRYGVAGCVLELGGTSAKASVPVSFNPDSVGDIAYSVPDRLRVLRSDLRYLPLPPPAFSLFSDREKLTRYLERSSDSREGIWTYLDRKTDPRKANPAGRYTIAIVRSGDDSYSIVYISGSGNESWKPMRIKGTLRPSGFTDNFDMEWICDDGTLYNDDTNASFTTSGRILECRFPALEATLRFRKSELSR